MTTRFFDVIDWTRPWMAPLLSAAEPILRATDWRRALNSAAGAAALRNHRGLPIRFVPQSDLPAGTAYEAFISATGDVPTRENLHDFLNALAWLTYPRIKAQLNAMQASELSKAGSHHAGRGNLRDAATIFDENAALLVTHDTELVDALRGHRWQEVFMARREEFGRHCEVWLFGHALMEKLVTPFKAITAHAWPMIAAPELFDMPRDEKRAWIDSVGAQELAKGLLTAHFTPLPVLGVPDWWPQQDDLFYEDAAVFRPRRQPAG
jgi:hypothetical protein